MKHCCCIMKYSYWGKSTCMTVSVVSWAHCFYMEQYFLLERTIARWDMVFHTSIFVRLFFQKCIKWACHFNLSHWTAFVANDQIQALKQKLEFWKTCICHHELDSFPILKDFSDEIYGNINKCNSFLHHIMRCVNVWKICIIQWANKFN